MNNPHINVLKSHDQELLNLLNLTGVVTKEQAMSKCVISGARISQLANSNFIKLQNDIITLR